MWKHASSMQCTFLSLYLCRTSSQHSQSSSNAASPHHERPHCWCHLLTPVHRCLGCPCRGPEWLLTPLSTLCPTSPAWTSVGSCVSTWTAASTSPTPTTTPSRSPASVNCSPPAKCEFVNNCSDCYTENIDCRTCGENIIRGLNENVKTWFPTSFYLLSYDVDTEIKVFSSSESDHFILLYSFLFRLQIHH